MYICSIMKEVGKDLIASSLAPMVLMILKRQESYGYELIQHLKEKSGGHLDVAEGTLYPVLKKMEAKEWIEAEWKKADNGRERKYYKITNKGMKELDLQIGQWDFIYDLMQQLWQPHLTLNKQ